MTSKFDRFRDNDFADQDFAIREELEAIDPLVKAGTPSDKQFDGRKKLQGAARITLDRIMALSQVREHFDETELEKLAHSLKHKGQVQPIRVRWSEEDEKYIIIMGERRFRAAQRAGLEALDCIVHEGEPDEAEIRTLQLIENLYRQDLNPIEEAKAFEDLITDRGCNNKQLAAEMGLSETAISVSRRLLNFPEDVQQAIAAGSVPKSVAKELLKIKSEDEQRVMLEQYLAGGTYGEIAGKVKAKKTGKAAGGAKTKKSFTSGPIKLQATAKKRVTNAEIATALRGWLEDLEADGRSRAA